MNENDPTSKIIPPRHLVWSTDRLDLADPFQRRWYLRQILMHGRAADIRRLDLRLIEQELDQLDLPGDLLNLWKRFLESTDD